MRRSIFKQVTAAVGATASLLLMLGAPAHAAEEPPTTVGEAPATVVGTPATVVGTPTTVAGAPAVEAVADTAGAVVRAIDTLTPGVVKLIVSAPGQQPLAAAAVQVTENGEPVSGTVQALGETAQARGAVLLVDTSKDTEQGNLIGVVRDSARAFVEAKSDSDQIAIVRFGGGAVTVTDFTADKERLRAAIDGLVADGDRRLWDGITTAGRAFVQQPTLQPNVVLITTGLDQGSEAGSGQAAAALDVSHSALFVAGLNFADTSVQSRAALTGGAWAYTADPAELPALLRGVKAALDNQFLVTYSSTITGDASFLIGVQMGEAQMSVTAHMGTLVVGAQDRALVAAPTEPLALFESGNSRLMIVILVLAAVATFGGAIVLIFVRRDDEISDRLSVYTDEAARRAALDGDPNDGNRAIGDSGMVRRAVKFTEDLATKHGFLEKVEARLDQADLPLRPAEALFFYIVAAVVLGLLVLVLAPNLIVGLILAGLVALAPMIYMKFRRGRRIRNFAEDLPDALQLLASTLRAGYSLLQGVDAVAQESRDPIGKELQRVMVEARLGRVLEEALDDVAVRMESDDFGWAVMAIRIQREVGGNLAELLQTVGETMVLRVRMRREIKALTAEGTISALVMGLLPLILGSILYMTAPEYIGTLFHHTLGIVLLAISGVASVIGVLWLRKLIRIDV